MTATVVMTSAALFKKNGWVILFLLLLHLETLELRKDVFFHQMERACMLQEHHGNNTMKDFS